MKHPQTCAEFVANIQEILATQSNQEKYYLDLSIIEKITLEELHRTPDLPPPDPVEMVFELILEEIHREHVDKIIYGLNELYKSYLRQIEEHNQEELSQRYGKRIFYLFNRSLHTCFVDEVWNFLSQSFRAVSLYLLEKGFLQACFQFWDYAAAMGKLAVKNGLPTDYMQSSLRLFEVQAEEQGHKELSRYIKKLRHDLEV